MTRTATATAPPPLSLVDQIAAELGAERSLGNIVAGIPNLQDVLKGRSATRTATTGTAWRC